MAQYQPKFWARYVDDTFVVIKKQHKTDFMGILNSVYPDIQFTMEEENQGALAFLDVLVQRQLDGFLTTRVYRKATCTDRILHFESNHPIAHKVSCVKTLFKRVESHCSTVKAKREERNHLFQVCKRNGYPARFINRFSIPSEPRSNPTPNELTPQTTRITLPYICNVSEATARILAPYNIQVAHRPSQTLRAAIMRPKDPLPNMERSAAIYKIECMDCPCNYVGETSKRVKTRVHEHRLAVKRGEQHSQIWTHMAELGHRFNFNEVDVLASDSTKGGRLLKEAWLSNGSSINRHIDLCPAHLALRSWSATNHPSRYHWPDSKSSERTIGDVPTPQPTRSNSEEEGQRLRIPTTPAMLTRLQKTKRAIEIKAQNPCITNIGDIPISVQGDTLDKDGERSLDLTPHRRAKDNYNHEITPIEKQSIEPPQPVWNIVHDHSNDSWARGRGIKDEKKDTHRESDWVKRDWRKEKDKYKLPLEPERGNGLRDRGNRRDKGFTSPASESKEKKVDEDTHAARKDRKKRTTGAQFNQLGPVTRSRSRVQTPACL